MLQGVSSHPFPREKLRLDLAGYFQEIQEIKGQEVGRKNCWRGAGGVEEKGKAGDLI